MTELCVCVCVCMYVWLPSSNSRLTPPTNYSYLYPHSTQFAPQSPCNTRTCILTALNSPLSHRAIRYSGVQRLDNTFQTVSQRNIRETSALLLAIFSSPVHTGPGPIQAPTQWVTGSFPGVKRPGRGVDHPPPSSAEVKETAELYLYSTSGPLWRVLG
jgi:hypothetical protein